MKSRDEYSEELNNQYNRLKRFSEKIFNELKMENRNKGKEEMLDSIYGFFHNCYHLKEWVLKDKKVTQSIKDKLPTFDKDDSYPPFLACRDLANKSKHSVLDKNRKPNSIDTDIKPYGSAFFTVGFDELNKRKGNETIHLKDEDSIFLGNFGVLFKGRMYQLDDTVRSCMDKWTEFFETNNLLIPRKTVRE